MKQGWQVECSKICINIPRLSRTSSSSNCAVQSPVSAQSWQNIILTSHPKKQKWHVLYHRGQGLRSALLRFEFVVPESESIEPDIYISSNSQGKWSFSFLQFLLSKCTCTIIYKPAQTIQLYPVLCAIIQFFLWGEIFIGGRGEKTGRWGRLDFVLTYSHVNGISGNPVLVP